MSNEAPDIGQHSVTLLLAFLLATGLCTGVCSGLPFLAGYLLGGAG